MKMRFIKFLGLLIIIPFFAVTAWATIIDLDLILGSATVSGFKIDGSPQEWLDLNTDKYDYNPDTGAITGQFLGAQNYGFRLATQAEWWAIANDVLSDGLFSKDENTIIGGYFSDETAEHHIAVGLVVPADGLRSGIIEYSNPNSTAWVSDSYSLTNTKAWVVRDINPIPEPTTILLLGIGLVGLAGLRRKYRR